MHLNSKISVLVAILAATAEARTIPQAASGSTCRKTKVAILGAGMAGIQAAHTLSKKGINDFIIIEGQDYIGGRLSHTEFGKNPKTGKPYTIELGANWVQGLTNKETGAENPIWTLAKKHKIKTTYTDYESIATFTHKGYHDYTDAIASYNEMFEAVVADAGYRMKNNLADRSFRAASRMLGWNPNRDDAITQTTEWWTLDFDLGTTPESVSQYGAALNYNSSFVVWSGENNLVVDPRGFNTLILGEAAEFLKGGSKDPRVMLNTWISGVNYTDSGVTVVAENGDCVQADYAICTFSLGVLQHEHAKLFSPALPSWKKEAINAFEMETYTKIFMQFPHRFWNDTLFSLYADPKKRGYYPIFQSLDAEGFMPGSNVYFVTVCDDESYRVEAQDDNTTKKEIMAVLRKMYPGVSIPEPTAFKYPRWTQERWARGSYSSWPVGVRREQHDNLRANVGRLYFAGEATSELYYGFIQGAYFEGGQAGANIASYLKGEKKPGLLFYPEFHNSQEVRKLSPKSVRMIKK